MKRLRIIALLCVIVLCISSCGKSTDKDADSTSNNEQTTMENTEQTEWFETVFYDYNGNKIKSEKVASGTDATPPDKNILVDGFVFMGWDKGLCNIKQNTLFYPQYEKISDKKNAIFYSSQYCDVGEQFLIDIQINGEVSYSCLELQIKFDDSILAFNEISYVDGDGVCHYDENSKTIYYVMASGTNINASVDLLSLAFTAKTSSEKTDLIQITVTDIAAYNSENELQSIPATIVNGKIFINNK